MIDGHGGRAAADYVAENLGKNIVKELERFGEAENQLEAVIRSGYSVTDKEFLSQVTYQLLDMFQICDIYLCSHIR